MTAPRRILEGTSYLVTRRCSERRFFLRPGETVNEVFLYVLAVAAERYGIRVHAFCVMSDHYHLLVTDPRAELPAFMQYLDGLVARAMNAALGRWEGFWSSANSYSAVAPGATEDIVSKAAYILANPVTAGLVQLGREWPGLWTAPEQLGVASLTAARPKGFFRENGVMPRSAELVLSVPPGFASAEEFQQRVAAATNELEREQHRIRQADGRGFLGRARVLAQKPTSRPLPGEPRRGLNPRIAARDKWKRLEALSQLKAFLREYRQALAALRAGLEGVVFPAGTYRLRIAFGVRCAPA